jgi:cystathionine beta-lyase
MDEFRNIDRSFSNAEKYQSRKRLFGSNDVQPLWVADMDVATPQCVLDAVRQRLNHPIFGYEIMPKSAFEAQCAWMHAHHGWKIDPQWLLYSPSVVASLGCAVRALSSIGDEIIVMSPVYPPFFSVVTDNHRQLIRYSLTQNREGRYAFDVRDLAKRITSKTTMLLLCSPHNPIGRVWDKGELAALGALCLAHKITIVSDEIHSDLVFEGYHHTPMASLSPELLENTVTLLGVGKTFNMSGFGISTVCIASEGLRQKFHTETQKIHWGEGSVLSHVAFETAYKEGNGWHQRLLLHLNNNKKRLLQWSDTQNFITIIPPEGTYLAWLDCRSLGMSDSKLRHFFINEALLGLSAGISFGREGSGFVRLNFAIAQDALEEVLDKLNTALAKLLL